MEFPLVKSALKFVCLSFLICRVPAPRYRAFFRFAPFLAGAQDTPKVAGKFFHLLGQ